MSKFLTAVNDRFWRMKFVADADDILGPARAIEGRSHYDGQRALYLSASPEGTIIASRRYMKPDDPDRAIFPLLVKSNRIIDLRDIEACLHFGIDTTHRATEWQSLRARGLPSPTWVVSDRVRELGLHGMLYASRSDPAKTHLTLFDWGGRSGAHVCADGSALSFNQSD